MAQALPRLYEHRHSHERRGDTGNELGYAAVRRDQEADTGGYRQQAQRRQGQ